MTRSDAGDESGAGLTHRVLGASLWMFPGAWLQGVLRLVVVTILARLLGPEDFGLVGAALIVIGFFQILLRTGVRPVLIQRPSIDDRHVRTAFTVSIAIGLVFSALVAVGAPWIASFGFRMPNLTPILQVIALVVPLQSFGIVATSLIERSLRFSSFVRIELFSYVVGYALVSVSMALSGFGAWSLVCGYVVQEALRTLLVMSAQPHAKRPLLDPEWLRELLYLGGGFSIARLGNFGALNGDKWVIGRWLGEQLLGFYKYAAELTGMIADLFGTVLDRVLFPAMAKIQDDPGRLATAYRTGVAMVAVMVLPTSAAITAVAPELIRVVLGPAWEPVIGPFRVLALALLFRATYSISDSLARATGAVYRRAWRQGIYAAAVIGFAWFGQHWGLLGAALGVVVAVAINFLLMADLSVRLASIRWRDVMAAHLGSLPVFAVTFGAMTGAAAICRAAGLSDFVVVALASAATGACLLLGLVFVPRALLGGDGANAVAMLLAFATERFDWFGRIPGMRAMGLRLARK